MKQTLKAEMFLEFYCYIRIHFIKHQQVELHLYGINHGHHFLFTHRQPPFCFFGAGGVPDKECFLPSQRVPALIRGARIIPGTPFRIVPISEKSGGFYPVGFTERLYPEIAYLSRVGVFMRQGLQWKAHSLQARTCNGKPDRPTGTPKSSKRKAY